MRIDKRQQKIIKDKLDEIWRGSKICPICLNEQWTTLNHVFFLPEFHYPKELEIGKQQEGTEYPAIVVACKVCGYFRTFNPILLGVFSQLSTGASDDLAVLVDDDEIDD